MADMFGLKIVSHPLLDGMKKPVLRIRDNVPCSEPTRSKVNDYLLKTFGEHEIAIFMPSDNSVFLSPKHYGLIKSKVAHG